MSARRLDRFGAVLLAMASVVSAPSTVTAQVQLGGNLDEVFLYDLEDFAAFAGPTGTAYSVLRNDALGISFGEKFAGQVTIPLGERELIMGLPSAPLRLDETVNPIYGVNVVTFRTTVVDGLGPVGHPSASAIGDGALSVLYALDQATIAFDVLGANGGTMRVRFFSRTTSVIGDLSFPQLADGTFSFTSLGEGIAGITITHDDMGGIAFDHFRFEPLEAPEATPCVLNGPLQANGPGEGASMTLSAELPPTLNNAGMDFEWSTDCPGGSLDASSATEATLHLEPASLCPRTCTVTLTVSDGSMQSTCETDVQIAGAERALTCPPSVSVECDGAGNESDVAAWTAQASAAWGNLAIVQESFEPTCGSAGVLTVQWELLDAGENDCGLETTCTSTFTVVDTTPPTFLESLEPLELVDEDCSGDEALALAELQAFDACSEKVSVTIDAPDAFPAGTTTTVTHRAVDECGNEASATQEVTVWYASGVEVHAVAHQTGSRFRRASKWNLPDTLVTAYDSAQGSCARSVTGTDKGLSWQHFAAIAQLCTPVRSSTTDEDGMALLDLPLGRYVLIAHHDADGDGQPDTFFGLPSGHVPCGQWKSMELQLLLDGLATAIR